MQECGCVFRCCCRALRPLQRACWLDDTVPTMTHWTPGRTAQPDSSGAACLPRPRGRLEGVSFGRMDRWCARPRGDFSAALCHCAGCSGLAGWMTRSPPCCIASRGARHSRIHPAPHVSSVPGRLEGVSFGRMDRWCARPRGDFSARYATAPAAAGLLVGYTVPTMTHWTPGRTAQPDSSGAACLLRPRGRLEGVSFGRMDRWCARPRGDFSAALATAPLQQARWLDDTVPVTM